VAGHESTECALKSRLVEFFAALQDLEQGVVKRRWIATIDRQQQSLQRGAEPGVNPPDGTEVE
jgi:hypothetical protein